MLKSVWQPIKSCKSFKQFQLGNASVAFKEAKQTSVFEEVRIDSKQNTL